MNKALKLHDAILYGRGSNQLTQRCCNFKLLEEKCLNYSEIQKALKETDMMTIMGPVKFEDWESYTNQDKPNTYVVQWQKGNLEVVWPADVKSADHVYPIPNWKDRVN